MDDPKVLAALVAAIISIVISSISGLYTVAQNRKRFDDLKKEIISKANAEKFVADKNTYLSAYSNFESEVASINNANPNDGTKTLQYIIDFYTDAARNFYTHNKLFLTGRHLKDLFEKINQIANSNILNEPGRDIEKREFGNMLLEFFNRPFFKVKSPAFRRVAFS